MARKIEKAMNQAIAAGKNWKQANTAVVANDDGTVEVYLLNRRIAELGDNFVTLFDGGYQSATTKARLNAILSENGIGNECVFQRDYQWFISYDGKVEPFRSGMSI